ncbi:hypothetical protein [Stenotrophomonas oahuensis]|uniref:Lipoprotein n=1 Tax=Stenotrophomonas oahuensis TaxID=3003271 RepID=A0ABY9YS76_9GAMM|nr:hypothetical protein [Stenotrophomonas sp. A5586]WNH53794.1 hypothetical protein PDM29_05805 [Stenotrophomonas sp. A5586]
MTLVALSLSLLLAGCKPNAAEPAAPAHPSPTAVAPAATTGTAPADAAPAEPVAADAQASCPYPDFDTFLPHFGAEIALQEKATADPLISEYVDVTADPEPAQVVQQIPLAEVTWPVMPNPASAGSKAREITHTTQPDGSIKVQFRTPNTSDQQSYYFAQKPCWQLVRKVDESI